MLQIRWVQNVTLAEGDQTLRAVVLTQLDPLLLPVHVRWPTQKDAVNFVCTSQ
jgi:hypothetical protein